MKGIVFTELLEMLDQQMSMEDIEALIDEADLPSGGAYSAVGTYDYQEILTLVSLLSEKINVPVEDLKNAFGKFLFGSFVRKYPVFFHDGDTVFDVLARVEDTIHVEVAKLYPDAELPKFDHQINGDRHMHMTYRSRRPFSSLAEGLIMGCIAYHEEDISVKRADRREGEWYVTEFDLEKAA